ncbi:MAG: PTS system mannose/fructose/sorbose family transporter subunit IID [Gemmatimonadota bacterium]
MTAFSRGVLTRVFLRSFIVQGSWNYRTLIGSGFAFALMPVLRLLYRNEPDKLDAAVRRHNELFNSHPYLAPLALGAVAVLEAEGQSELVGRFKAAVRGSLGTLGDRLVWSGWRPICALAALTMSALGAPWWTAVLVYLVFYNAGHLTLRVYSFQLGLRHGRRVGEVLRTSPLNEAHHTLDAVGAALVGLLLPLTIARPVFPGWGGALWIVALAGAAMLGLVFGGRVRTPVVLVLAAATIVALLVSVL